MFTHTYNKFYTKLLLFYEWRSISFSSNSLTMCMYNIHCIHIRLYAEKNLKYFVLGIKICNFIIFLLYFDDFECQFLFTLMSSIEAETYINTYPFLRVLDFYSKKNVGCHIKKKMRDEIKVESEIQWKSGYADRKKEMQQKFSWHLTYVYSTYTFCTLKR